MEEKLKVKVCQTITFDKDVELVSMLGEDKVVLPAGSQGIIDKRGNVRITSRELYGKILPQSMFNFEIVGTDDENLCDIVVDRLINRLPDFKNYLDDYDVTKKEVAEEIWESIIDFL